MPKVSIIMPVFNGGAYIRESIKSVLAQTFTDFELLIVDDGSTDDTATIIRDEYQRQSIHFFQQTNQGPSAARNLALRHAQGRFIAFLDADDIWKPNKLEQQLPLFTNPNVGVVYGNAEFLGKTIEGKENFFAINEPARGVITQKLLEKNFIPMLTVVIRTDIFHELVGFDPHLRAAEDYDLWLRASLLTEFDFTENLIAKYRIHPTAITQKSALMWQSELMTLWKMWCQSGHSLNAGMQNKLANRLVTLADKVSTINRPLAKEIFWKVWRRSAWRSWPRRFWLYLQ